MEGLHIFNQTEIFELPSSYIWIFIGGGLFLMLIGRIIIDLGDNSGKDIVELLGVACMTIGFMVVIGFSLSDNYFEKPTGKYQYTVSVDDSKVNLTEFYNNYEIIRQEGELWIIKDKHKVKQ